MEEQLIKLREQRTALLKMNPEPRSGSGVDLSLSAITAAIDAVEAAIASHAEAQEVAARRVKAATAHAAEAAAEHADGDGTGSQLASQLAAALAERDAAVQLMEEAREEKPAGGGCAGRGQRLPLAPAIVAAERLASTTTPHRRHWGGRRAGGRGGRGRRRAMIIMKLCEKLARQGFTIS